MKPLDVEIGQITVNNVLQTLFKVFIPANTWADFKRLIVWADVGLNQNNPPHPGGRLYGEAYVLQGGAATPRGGPQPIANSFNPTRYVIQREYQFEFGLAVYEQNWDIQGNTELSAAANVEHRVFVNALDNTLDAYLEFQFGNNFAGSLDTMFCHTAKAWIEAPLDLGRLPR